MSADAWEDNPELNPQGLPPETSDNVLTYPVEGSGNMLIKSEGKPIMFFFSAPKHLVEMLYGLESGPANTPLPEGTTELSCKRAIRIAYRLLDSGPATVFRLGWGPKR